VSLHPVDLAVIAVYLVAVALVGFVIRKRATKRLDSYYLADRNVPWWMLGLAGCSSYIDIGGTMSMIGALFYLGMKAAWATHIYWGWFIICFYMAFQAKWIRRSGVMTFAEWNVTRFGKTRDAEAARVSAALFLLVLMICNLMFISVGIGKFAEEFLPFGRIESTLVVLAVVGVYVTLGGFFGVILTDILQTFLIACGAVILAIMVFSRGDLSGLTAAKDPAWFSLTPSWTLWPGFLETTPPAYQHFHFLGPIMLAGFLWLIFRVLAGPNVWDFQFFLTTRSPRDAQLAGGMWTVGYTLRWVIGSAFLVLGILSLGPRAGFDAEKIMPLVLKSLPVGLRGVFMAVLLAALMSTISAMINVTSSVVINDFVKRYFARGLSQKALVRLGQLASVGALGLGFYFSLSFTDVVTAWETMIFIVVTVILVPATLRWHYWRFSAGAFVWSMGVSAALILIRKIVLGGLSAHNSLGLDMGMCLAATLIITHLHKPTDMDVLVRFYSRVRPFGFWGPVRREAVRRGLVPEKDKMPAVDALNGFITAGFQFSLALMPFTLFLRRWTEFALWTAAAAVLAVVLYFTWYKNLPPRDELVEIESP
jgi:solute:Na+ symporter, SSS family